jgi:hypothetical protein
MSSGTSYNGELVKWESKKHYFVDNTSATCVVEDC